MIRFRNATRQFSSAAGRSVVLDGVSAVFPRGRSILVFGGKQSGKTTLMRLLSGADMLDEGSLAIDVDMSWPIGSRSAFAGAISVRDAATFIARLYGEPPGRVLRFVSSFSDLRGKLDKPISKLGPEPRRRVLSSLSLAIEFDCYLIDDDVGPRRSEFTGKCWELLAERQQDGADLIMATSRVQGVPDLFDMGALLHDGSLTMFDDVNEAAHMFLSIHPETTRAGSRRKIGREQPAEGQTP